MDDVAAFLVDNPEADQAGELPNDDEPGDPENSDGEENPSGDDADGAGPDSDDPDADSDEDDPAAADAAQKQTSQKFKVTVKGEDGADIEQEVDAKELIAGYQRHADYTRKTQELGNREREAHELVSRRLEEGRNHYMQEAQKAHAAIRTLAGLKSDAEMAQLAQTDQAAWVQERARTEAIKGVLAQIEQGMTLEQQQAQHQQQVAQQQEFQKAWGVLGQQGIDKPKLKGIFDGVAKAYGVEETRFANVTDPKVVLIMRDALAYRELKEKAAAVKKQVKTAPNLPAQRQKVPQKEQANKRLNQKFRSGNAGVKDLAAFLMNN
ncbi:hypothetical protein ACSFBF_06925 [Variovorax sp. ZT5P49]|uniref:hypothetical protein n=1 Tax=Variovorax sp. ZT5P49 TaxID=3443733 RepID=UPI003F46313F